MYVKFNVLVIHIKAIEYYELYGKNIRPDIDDKGSWYQAANVVKYLRNVMQAQITILNH
jgi:hypothetical protein